MYGQHDIAVREKQPDDWVVGEAAESLAYKSVLALKISAAVWNQSL